MANRIIIVDGDWSGDNIKFVSRSSYPMTIEDVEPGQWLITNTITNANSITVQVQTQQSSTLTISDTENGFVIHA